MVVSGNSYDCNSSQIQQVKFDLAMSSFVDSCNTCVCEPTEAGLLTPGGGGCSHGAVWPQNGSGPG